MVFFFFSFYLGSNMGKDLNIKPTQEGMDDHILLHCTKVVILWLLIYALFGIKWMMHSSVRSIIGILVEKKRKKVWIWASWCLFWAIWKKRNSIAFENIENMDQAIKQSFMYNFLGWVRVYIGDYSMTMVDFIDWLSSKWGESVVFCVLLLFVWPFGVFVYTV